MLVVNTCAFIDRAKQESIDAILEMAQQKRDGRCTRLVVTGCLAERYRDELRKEIPEIDAVLGTGEVPQIVDAHRGTGCGMPEIGMRSRWTSDRRGTGAARLSHRRSPDPASIASPTSRTAPHLPLRRRHAAAADDAAALRLHQDRRRLRLHLRVLHHPDAARRSTAAGRTTRSCARRGRWRSAASRELLLISQDTTFYGIDRGERGALARCCASSTTIDGLEWIRLLYLYPTTITDDVLEAMAECEKVCRYVDLPLQHASADVLKRMRRPGNRKTYDTLLARIRERVPGVTLRTTFIVGFPGETERRFRRARGASSTTPASITSASSPTRTRKARGPSP